MGTVLIITGCVMATANAPLECERPLEDRSAVILRSLFHPFALRFPAGFAAHLQISPPPQGHGPLR